MGKRSKRGIPEERIEKVGLHGLRRQYGPATGRERGALGRELTDSAARRQPAGSVGPSLTGNTTGPATLPE